MYIHSAIQLKQLMTLVLATLLMSCATSPEFNTEKVDSTLTPQSVIADPDNSMGKIALWGGTILDTRNLEKNTQIEVLAYPLDSYQRPLQSKKPLGRFLIVHSGYLEPETFSPGKLVSVLGGISKSQPGKIGESHYTYPVVVANQLHLWSLNDSRSKTSFHFGIGIRL